MIKQLFLIGPTAGGKTTFADLIKKYITDHEKYNSTTIHFVNDYQILSKMFIEDDIRESKGLERLHSKKYAQFYSVISPDVFNELNKKLVQKVSDMFAKDSDSPNSYLIISELSRSGKLAYRNSLREFPSALLQKSCIVYLSVKYEETLHRNHHRDTYSLPDERLAEMNSSDDWLVLTKGEKNGSVILSGTQIPFITIDNNDRLSINEVSSEKVKEKINQTINFIFERRINK